MAPSKDSDHLGGKVSYPNPSKRSTATQRTASSEDMDSSRPIPAADMSSTGPETAAMIDVSSWAQRGLVLENKDLRRTLEMTKSAHAAQLAQITKRHRTEKEELEVKLQAELYRQTAHQRTMDELSTRLGGLQEENTRLTENGQALDTQLMAKSEENIILQRELEDSNAALKSTSEELDAVKSKHEELIARESRVAVVLNDQHHKIMNLSQAYNELQEDKQQLQAALQLAEKEVERLKNRMSSILNTLVKVVHDNGEQESDSKLAVANDEGMKDVLAGQRDRKVEGRKRTRAGDLQAMPISSSPTPLRNINVMRKASVAEEQNLELSPVPSPSRNRPAVAPAISPSAGITPHTDASTDNQRTVIRAKRRRIVSDPDSGETQLRAKQSQIKQEPRQSDMMRGITTTQTIGEDGTLDIEESTMVTEVEVSIPATTGTGMETLPEGGEESPERAAVESAIGVQDEERDAQAMEDESEASGTVKKPTRTYAKRRKTEEATSAMAARMETPTPGTLANSTSSRGKTLATPLTDRLHSTPSQTASYATRAKTAKSSKQSSPPGQSLASPGSPLKKRQHGKHHPEGNDGKSSPGMIRVKEEISDPIYDSRPRITGGDDEGKYRPFPSPEIPC